MHGDLMIAAGKLTADVGIGHSSDFPSAIEMLEALADESDLSLIPKNQVRVGHRPVLAEVPSLADLEVADQVRRDIRSEWNLDKTC